MVAVAGTATTVQAISLDLEVHDPDLIHHGPLALAEAEAVFRALARMTLAERTAIPVMAPGRAEVIVAGAAVLVEVMRRWGIEQVIVSEHDILDGHAAELLSSR
jgi:exopolyphosphatase/guanosine-5'-triphosphate,3'-diphosphate pyrophosphatase